VAATAATALRADPARTVQTLQVVGPLPPAPSDLFTKANRQTLLTSGIATVDVTQSGAVRLERMVTTYQTNAYGVNDQSYLDTETLYDLMFVTRDLRAFVTQTFPRAKLAQDGTRAGAGSSVVTPRAVKAALVSRYAALEALGMVQNTASFAAGLVVQINGQDPNRLDVLYDPILMGNLRIFATLNQFRLK
jgi:phage tail sheath gpL-like